MDIIDLVTQTAAEEATANVTHTKAMIEEVDTHVKKLNQYENGKLSKTMTTAINKLSKAVADTDPNMGCHSTGKHGNDEQHDCKHASTATTTIAHG